MNLTEGSLLEFVIFGDVCAFDIPLPPVLKAPRAGFRLPEDASGKDAAREREARGVELEDREIGEFAAIPIKELVLENASRFSGAGLPKYPFLLWMQEGLRRSALDDAAQCLLALVGLGQIELIEEKEAQCQDSRD